MQRGREITQLRKRLADAEETLRAIRSGEVDAVVVAGKQGTQVFTLEGAEHSYRVLIESMNEGALTLTAGLMILYANRCFSNMVKHPLEQVLGGSLRRFLSATDEARLRPLMKSANKSGSKIQVMLRAGDGSLMPVQISIRPLPKAGFKNAPLGLVVTDLTAARRSEELLRALTHRLVHAQETERGRLALEMHDTITQMLCGVLVCSQTLADKLPARNRRAKGEAMRLHELICRTVEEAERISRDLRPGVLNLLGLVAGLHEISTQFANRTGVLVKLVCVQLISRLPADTELTLYRILQETLKNVEKHARAHHVTIHLAKLGEAVKLTVNDDGIGFDPDRLPAVEKGKSGFGLLGMRERASSVGGVLKIKSIRRAGTEIDIQIPLPPEAAAANRVPRKLLTKAKV